MLRQCAILAGVLAASSPAQTETRASLSVTDEASATAGTQGPVPRTGNLLLVESSFAWRRADRWRSSVSVAGIAAKRGESHARLRVKEAWAGLTLGDFDFTAGKRIVRWGTGYAFTPTGVLDPPRNPADPADRLSLNEGREMVAADWVKGRHAITAALASGGLLDTHRPGLRETAAVRYNTLIEGFDSALVFARERGRPNFYGLNFTRVAGEALEIHGELAHRDATSILLGGKYTLRSGAGAIFEWYSPAPGRPRYVFARIGKARLRELPGWKHWDASFALLANTSDRSRMIIADLSRRIRDQFSAYGHAELPGGRRWRSEYGMIPYSALLSIGLRYQI